MSQNKTKNKNKGKKKSKVGIVFFTAITFILLLFIVSFFVYMVGSYPDFNSRVDDLLLKIENSDSITQGEKQDESETLNSVEKAEKTTVVTKASVFSTNAVFSGLLLGEIDFDAENIIKDSLQAQTDFNIQQPNYSSDYPIVSSINSFEDCFVFLDAQPALVRIHKQTGEEKRTECPVYPGSKACVIDTDYIFSGRDGRQYIFSFGSNSENYNSVKNYTEYVNEANSLSYYMKKIAPDAKAQSSILDSLKIWASFSDDDNLPEMQFIDANKLDELYSMKSNIETNDFTAPSLFVFSPNEQGLYKIGLCNDEGLWLNTRAYVAIFTGDELSLVSLDYKSDEPQVQLQLSNRQLYYIVAGNFSDTSEFGEYSNLREDESEKTQRSQMFLKIEEAN